MSTVSEQKNFQNLLLELNALSYAEHYTEEMKKLAKEHTIFLPHKYQVHIAALYAGLLLLFMKRD
jgi:hypothetical protein